MARQVKKSIVARRAKPKSRKAQVGAAPAPLLSADVALGAERAAREFRKYLTSDGIDAIVIADLCAISTSLKQDLERRVENKTAMSVFDNNRKKDIAMLRQHISAFETVLRYYGGLPELR